MYPKNLCSRPIHRRVTKVQGYSTILLLNELPPFSGRNTANIEISIRLITNMKQTKIVASISDRRCDQDFIRKLFFAGMNVVRMNTAHATEEGIRTIVKNVRAVSPHIGIMIDTKGPEVRTTGVKEPIHYNVGDVVKIFGRPEMESSHDIVNVSYPDIAADVKVGDDLLFDDGELDMKIIDSQGPMLVAEVQNEGVLGAHKSVNVPGEHIDLPALTEKDRRNIELAIELDIDFIAHSFVRNAADVKAVQDILDAHNSDIKIISKIENQEGVDNIDEIIDACSKVSKDLKDAIDTAYENIKKFHAAQTPHTVKLETYPGIVCETHTHPIDSVGLYVPGGSAPLVSTALMLAVPAAIAGCPEVILCSPPPISDAIIYAATKAGVKRIFNLGGAQAIAAVQV